MTRKNRNFSPEDKVRILKRRLIDSEPISQICSSESIAPTQFYAWQKAFFENGAAAFTKTSKQATQATEAKISRLEATLQRKDRVIAEITEENIDLKEGSGEI